MNLKKSFGRVAAAFLATAMLASVTAIPVSAESNEAYIATFKKTIDMSDAVGASVPRLTYSYDAEAAERIAATDTNPEILAGVGSLTITPAVFNNLEDFVAEGETSITKEVSITIPADTYTAPGIYRYKITEKDKAADVAGMSQTEDDDIYYLDVYVEDLDGTMTVTHTIMTRDAFTPVLSEDGKSVTYGEGEGSKVNEDVDKYTTYTLTITKKVAGTLANAGATYDFAANFTGLGYGTSLSYADGEDMVRTKYTQDGSLTVDFSIAAPGRDGRSYTIYGVPANAAYTVVEKLSKGEGYTVTAELTAGGSSNTPTDPGTGEPAGFTIQYVDRHDVTQSVKVGCAVLNGDTLEPITDGVASAETFLMENSPKAISSLVVPTVAGYVNANTAYVNDGGVKQVLRIRYNAERWEYQYAEDKQYYPLSDNALYFIYTKDGSSAAGGKMEMNYVEADDNYASNSIGMNAQDNAVTITNTKETVNPTGVVMDIAPYALLVVVAAAGCFVFLRKRRED